MATQKETDLDRAWVLVHAHRPEVVNHADWAEIGTDIGNALLKYLATAHPMGDFLQCVVAGELHEAAARADLDNFEDLGYFGRWIFQTWPRDAFGSREKLNAWKGLAHRAEERAAFANTGAGREHEGAALESWRAREGDRERLVEENVSRRRAQLDPGDADDGLNPLRDLLRLDPED